MQKESGGEILAIIAYEILGGFKLLTHNTEVLAYDGKEIYTCPIKARNLSGRTGRGDTAFAGYIAARQSQNIQESLLYCTALVSLKMETPGPFKGTKKDVLDYIKNFY